MFYSNVKKAIRQILYKIYILEIFENIMISITQSFYLFMFKF